MIANSNSLFFFLISAAFFKGIVSLSTLTGNPTFNTHRGHIPNSSSNNNNNSPTSL